MLAEDHAIIVHESAHSMGEFIACGDIDGEMDADGSLIVELDEIGDSGVKGQAVLECDADGTTSDIVTLADAGGTPVG